MHIDIFDFICLHPCFSVDNFPRFSLPVQIGKIIVSAKKQVFIYNEH